MPTLEFLPSIRESEAITCHRCNLRQYPKNSCVRCHCKLGIEYVTFEIGALLDPRSENYHKQLARWIGELLLSLRKRRGVCHSQARNHDNPLELIQWPNLRTFNKIVIIRSGLLRSYRRGLGARFWNRQTHLSLRHKRPYTQKARVVTADAGPRSSEWEVTADGVPDCDKGRNIDRLIHFSETSGLISPARRSIEGCRAKGRLPFAGSRTARELPLWEAVQIYFDLTGDRGCFSVPALFYIGSVRRCAADR